MVKPHLPNAIISSVNLSEVLSKSADVGVTLEQMQWSVGQLPIQCITYDKEQAYITASMREITRKQGLSLGDRACLALGLLRRIPVLTADKSWQDVPVDVEVRLIR
jgi:PIN domain nuclease of toxin-antitoxin system